MIQDMQNLFNLIFNVTDNVNENLFFEAYFEIEEPTFINIDDQTSDDEFIQCFETVCRNASKLILKKRSISIIFNMTFPGPNENVSKQCNIIYSNLKEAIAAAYEEPAPFANPVWYDAELSHMHWYHHFSPRKQPRFTYNVDRSERDWDISFCAANVD